MESRKKKLTSSSEPTSLLAANVMIRQLQTTSWVIQQLEKLAAPLPTLISCLPKKFNPVKNLQWNLTLVRTLPFGRDVA